MQTSNINGIKIPEGESEIARAGEHIGSDFLSGIFLGDLLFMVVLWQHGSVVLSHAYMQPVSKHSVLLLTIIEYWTCSHLTLEEH